MLVQKSETNSLRAHNIALIRCLIATDQTKHSSLARPVSADKADVFARIYLQRCTTQDILLAVRFMNF